ncbi:hypothetical protein JM18_003690 [Phytophthora kernoviae]|uniref:RxLR effector protein n=2 Tax=Phytophthora kernoviae TaxID=325452 RepID=A0A921VA69_9STRA|nr:hypothetical protein G195_005258 [Phytophthora kernoviae 00238/432]KAG2527260.1 hypothetical protein JM18_003690 [Phytophthora kernoviae]
MFNNKIFALCITVAALSSGAYAEMEVAETFSLLGAGLHGRAGGGARIYGAGTARVGAGAGLYGSKEAGIRSGAGLYGAGNGAGIGLHGAGVGGGVGVGGAVNGGAGISGGTGMGGGVTGAANSGTSYSGGATTTANPNGATATKNGRAMASASIVATAMPQKQQTPDPVLQNAGKIPVVLHTARSNLRPWPAESSKDRQDRDMVAGAHPR